MADAKWTVDFHDHLDEQLEPGKLTDGKVSEVVQQEINRAIRHAVLSTLESHGLLKADQTQRLMASASGPPRELNPVKPSRPS